MVATPDGSNLVQPSNLVVNGHTAIVQSMPFKLSAAYGVPESLPQFAVVGILYQSACHHMVVTSGTDAPQSCHSDIPAAMHRQVYPRKRLTVMGYQTCVCAIGQRVRSCQHHTQIPPRSTFPRHATSFCHEHERAVVAIDVEDILLSNTPSAVHTQHQFPTIGYGCRGIGDGRMDETLAVGQ